MNSFFAWALPVLFFFFLGRSVLWPVMIHSSQLTGKSAPLNPKDINHEHHEFKKDQKTQTK